MTDYKYCRVKQYCIRMTKISFVDAAWIIKKTFEIFEDFLQVSFVYCIRIYKTGREQLIACAIALIVHPHTVVCFTAILVSLPSSFSSSFSSCLCLYLSLPLSLSLLLSYTLSSFSLSLSSHALSHISLSPLSLSPLSIYSLSLNLSPSLSSAA